MIELKKKGQSINLSKKGNDVGEILVNLKWNQNTKAAKSGGFLILAVWWRTEKL